jgi:acyl-CoA reductase-like NAD-dependent aldehyde dehydrogenase
MPPVVLLTASCLTLPQVSEYASWSTLYYNKFIQAALAKAGAPADLVQFVTGYGEAGNALVTGGERVAGQQLSVD